MKITAIFAACAAFACGLAQAAGITLYGQPGFAGPQITVRDGTASLANAGFQDQASSARVDSGRWEICTQPEFRGECVVLGPGEYGRLDDRIFHRAESLRPVDERAGRGRAYAAREDRDYEARNERRGSIELYGDTNYRRPLVTLDHDRKMLDLGGGVWSIVVNEGVWEACPQVMYDGRCHTFEPGRYPDLGHMDNHVMSVRRIG